MITIATGVGDGGVESSDVMHAESRSSGGSSNSGRSRGIIMHQMRQQHNIYHYQHQAHLASTSKTEAQSPRWRITRPMHCTGRDRLFRCGKEL